MSIYVKICGITNTDDALAAVDAGADALGFNFYPGSPRFIDVPAALEILKEIPPAIHRVGVFVNTPIEAVIDIALDLELHCLQFHGEEPPQYCNSLARPWYKAFRLQREDDLLAIPQYEAPWLMVDAASSKGKGGTGELARWDLARAAKQYGKLILAGGLTPENIVEALNAVEPEAVDVASGVEERPGIKNHDKMITFIEKVKGWTKP